MSPQSTQASTNSIAQAEIVDTAKPPIGPTRPTGLLLIAVVFILAIVAGAGTVTVQELLVTGFRTVEEVESKLGLPVLAALPALPKNNKPADMLLEKPTSFYSEALRIARASLLGVRGDNAPKIIAVTSALPEGKTTTSLALARTMALNNARTLLFECDVRRAVMQHSVRSPAAAVGTVEVVMGEAPLDSAITPGDVPHLDHLLVTTPYFSPATCSAMATWKPS
jgi:Mrp family chromosome partitioning ATPase